MNKDIIMGPIVKFSLNLTVNPSWSPAFRLEEELFGGQFSAPTANPCLSTASVQKHAWPSARALGANAGTGGDDRPGATSPAAAAVSAVSATAAIPRPKSSFRRRLRLRSPSAVFSLLRNVSIKR